MSARISRCKSAVLALLALFAAGQASADDAFESANTSAWSATTP